MKYRHFPAAALAAGLLFCTLFSGLTAYADDKKSELTQKQTETRQEYEAAQSALEELQNEQTQTESEVAALTGQAAELAGQITAVTDAVQNAQTVLDERQAAADAARAALDAKQAEYDARLAVCREQLRAMQRLDGGGAFWLLAQAKSLYQLLTFDAVLQQMSARNSTVLAELDAEAAALEAPFTSPAMSTNSITAGVTFLGLCRSASQVRRSSGTDTTPTLGSMVQKA